jgi:MFS family permease
MTTAETSQKHINTSRQVLFASPVGTTIEFFDFYIYATAAMLVFPRLFFPASNPASSTLASLATFGIAFLARPIGSALFGHFGDRMGRKKTLVLALSTMGLSTLAIGALPAYAIGLAAPLLLALCRFGQGIGLGGEWGGAVLLAVENAPPNKRALYGMFPQLGARPSACSPEEPSSCCRAGSPTSSSSPSAGGCHSSPAPCWCCSGTTFA